MDYQKYSDQFLQWLKGQIPLINHMGFEQLQYDGATAAITAALEPNVNDKGTGFGGSLATVATLSGWSLVTLLLREHYHDCDVVIADSHLEYLAPVRGKFTATARLDEQADQSVSAFVERVQQKGRGRMDLIVELYDGDTLALRLRGRYVAMEKPVA